MPIPSITGKTPPPMLLKRVANADVEPVQIAAVMEEPDRASTEIEEVTEIDDATELEPPHRGDVTELVSPLPIEPGDLTQMTREPVASRRYLYFGAVAVTALVVAILIMLTGRSVEGPTAPPAEPPAVVTPKLPEPKIEKAVEPVIETKPVEPVVEPTPDPVVAPIETKVVEPTPLETKPARTVRRPVRKPTPKPVPKSTPRNPQWDPDALFLKPKK